MDTEDRHLEFRSPKRIDNFEGFMKGVADAVMSEDIFNEELKAVRVTGNEETVLKTRILLKDVPCSSLKRACIRSITVDFFQVAIRQ